MRNVRGPLSIVVVALAIVGCGGLLGLGEDDAVPAARASDASAGSPDEIADASSATGESGGVPSLNTNEDAGTGKVLRAFVTSDAVIGSELGSRLPGICDAALATGAPSDTYVPFVHDAKNKDWAAQLAGYGPWLLVGTSTKVADDYADLVDGTIDAPIDRTETGAILTGEYAWTGENGIDCAGWTGAADVGTMGVIGAVDATWASVGTKDCSAKNHVYCFQVQ